MSDKPDTLEQAIEDLFDHQGVHGAERDRKRRLLLGLAADLEAIERAEIIESMAALLRPRFPDLTDEELWEIADTT